MQCCNQDTSALPRVRRGNDHPFTLVIRSSPEGYDLGEGKGEQLNPEELKDLRVTIYEPNFGGGFTPEIRYFGNSLGFELSSTQTKKYGTGVYEAEVSFALNGDEEHTLRRPLCRVVKEDEEVARHNNTLVLELAPIAKGDRGDRGQSAYEAYLDNTDDDPKMTEAEWVASLKSATDKLREAKEYTEEVAREGYRGRLTKYEFDLTDKSRSMWFAVAVIYAEGEYNPQQNWVGKVITIRASCPRAYLEWEAFPYSNELVVMSEDVVTTRVTRQAMLSHSASSHISKPEGSNGEGFRYESVYLRGGELWTVSVWAEGVVRVLGMKDYRTAEYEELKRYQRYSYTFDLTQLDANKYYAAIIQLPTQVNINQPDRYNIVVYAGLDKSIPKPPYATHAMGFSAELRWSVSAPGNGARYDGRIVESFGAVSVKSGEQVMSQPYHSAVLRSEYVYLRGGFVYQCRVTSDFAPTFTLAATDFTISGRNAVITSPVDSITPPKSDVERLRDDMREGDKATLEGAKNAATAKAKEAVDALQLGGRNYALNTANTKEGSAYLLSEYRVGAPWVPGVDYTISFVLGSESPDTVAYIYVDSFSTSDAAVRPEDTPTQGADGLYYARYSATFRTTAERIDLSVKRIAGGNGGFRLYKTKRLGSRDEGRYALSRVMLERGNKPSDWTLAPEDTEAAIAALVQRVAALEAARQA